MKEAADGVEGMEDVVLFGIREVFEAPGEGILEFFGGFVEFIESVGEDADFHAAFVAGGADAFDPAAGFEAVEDAGEGGAGEAEDAGEVAGGARGGFGEGAEDAGLGGGDADFAEEAAGAHVGAVHDFPEGSEEIESVLGLHGQLLSTQNNKCQPEAAQGWSCLTLWQSWLDLCGGRL